MKHVLIPDKRISFLIFAFILLISCNIFSQTKTFTAANNNNWNNGSNWIPNGVPSDHDDVVIPAGKTCVVNATGSCQSITFSGGSSASNLNILFFRGLTVTGSVTINNSVRIDIDPLSFLTIKGSLIINDSTVISSLLGTLELQNGIINNGVLTTDGYLVYQFTTNNQTISENPVTFSGNINIGASVTLTNATTLTINGTLNGNNASSSFINAEGVTLNIRGNLLSTGSLDASASGNTVNYSGTDQTIKEAVYYNLTLSGSGTKTLPVSASEFNINGNLIIGDSTTLNGNDRIINIKENWTSNGSFTNPNSVSLIGTTAQTIDGTDPLSLDTLIINNPAGVILAKALMVNDLLQLTNGIVTTSSANLLTLSAGGSIIGGSVSSFINGPLARVKNTLPEQTLRYPIGKGTSYRPIELKLTHGTSTGSTYKAEVFNTAPASRTLPGTLSSVSNARYWNVTKTGPAILSSAYVTLNYGIDDGVTGPADLRVAKSNGSVWENIGGTGSGTPEGSILSAQFASFSDFVLANATGGSNPLPVELSSFTASSAENNIILKWTTKTEIQNYGFEIERSVKPGSASDDYNWINIGFVNGSGNSNSPKEYSFVDKQLSAGIYLFRLKQLDADGSFQYSNEIEINIENFPGAFRLDQNYPNPFNPTTTIKFSVNQTGPVSIKVYDALGNEVKTLFNETAESGIYYSVEFDGSVCASGVYYYTINGNDLHAVKKMLLIK